MAYPLGRAQKWFHRVFNPQTGEDVYKYSASFFGYCQRKIWEAQTRPNALFFSTAIQLNNEQLKPADWFKQRLQVIDSTHHLGNGYTVSRCKNDAYKTPHHRLHEFSRFVDCRYSPENSRLFRRTCCPKNCRLK